MRKRIFSFILALLICLGAMPVGAFAEEAPASSAETAGAVPEQNYGAGEDHSWQEEDDWDEPDGGEGVGFQPYVFSTDGDDSVSATVSLQPELTDGIADDIVEEEEAGPEEILPPEEQEPAAGEEPAAEEEEGEVRTQSADAEDEENEGLVEAMAVVETASVVPVAEVQDATLTLEDGNVTAVVSLQVSDLTDVTKFWIFEITDNEDEKITKIQDTLIKARAEVPVSDADIDEDTVELTAVLDYRGNAPTDVGSTTAVAVMITKTVDGTDRQSALSNPFTVTVEGTAEVIPAPELINATLAKGAGGVVTVSFLVPSTTGVTQFGVYEVAEGEDGHLIKGVDDNFYSIKAEAKVALNDAVVRDGEDGNKTVEMRAALNTPTAAGRTTLIGVTVIKRNNESALSIPKEVTVTSEEGEHEEQGIPAPELLTAECVLDGTAVLTSVSFLAENVTDLKTLVLYELTEEDPTETLPTVVINDTTYYGKNTVRVPYDDGSMNRGLDPESGRTKIEAQNIQLPCEDDSWGKQVLIALQVVRHTAEGDAESEISSPVQTRVEADPEFAASFTPTNVYLSAAANATDTVEVTVTWDAVESPYVQSYMIENGLINGDGFFPLNGAAQGTVVPGNGTGTTYQTADGINVLKYSVQLLGAQETQIEDGTARGVKDGDTIGTGLCAVAGPDGQKTAQTNATTVLDLAGSETASLNSNLTTVRLEQETYLYTGVQVQPKVVRVDCGNRTLEKGRDYYVSYGENLNVGNGTVTVYGLGDFTDSCTVSFPINPALLSEDNTVIVTEPESITFSGETNEPEVTVTWIGPAGNFTLETDSDYTVSYGNNTFVATGGTVTVSGTGNYCGNVTAEFDIAPLSLNSDSITVELLNDTYIYTGSAIEAEISVKLDETELEKGPDYSVVYVNNTKVGTAEARVTGRGNFNDTVVKEFTIRLLENYTISFEPGDGIGNMTNMTAIENQPFTLPENLFEPAEGREFDAWEWDGDTWNPGEQILFTEDAVVTAQWRDELPLDMPAGMSLNQAYLLLTPDSEPVQMATNLTESEYLSRIKWTTESGTEDVISVDDDGLVSVKGIGTDYAVAFLSSKGQTISARCRIDVLDKEAQGKTKITASLPITSVTANLYRTEPARVNVILKLEQNLVKPAGLEQANEIEDLDDSGFAITNATFTGARTRQMFRLHIVDDRTLEILPMEDFDPDDATQVGAFASSYKSAILLTLSDGIQAKQVTTPELTVKVSKTLPTLKASTVKLNRFIEDHTQPLAITGAEVSSILAASGSALDFANLNAENRTLTLKSGVTKNTSGKLKLKCELEGWVKPVTVTVTVNAGYTAPKLSFSQKTLTLNPAVNETAVTAYTLTPLKEVEHKVDGALVYESVDGKNKAVTGDPLSVTVDSETETVQVQIDSIDDGKAHTYKVYPLVDGQKVSALTVKVLKVSKKTAPQIQLKASGSINTKVPDSPVTLTVTGINCNARMTDGFELTIVAQKKNEDDELFYLGDKDEVTYTEGCFEVEYPEDKPNTCLITGTDKLIERLSTKDGSGWTYKAQVTANVSESGELLLETNAVKLSIQNPKKTPAKSVTLKAKGSIDVLRAGTAVTLTPSYKNLYKHELAEADLVFYKVVKNKNVRITDPIEIPFDVEVVNGTSFTVTQRDGAVINTKTQAFAVGMMDASSNSTKVLTKTPLKLNVKMGKATVAQNVKTVTLSKNDRFDRQSVLLKLNDDTLYGIEDADVVLTGSKYLELKKLGTGEYAIGYKNQTLSKTKAFKSMKSETVKLYVYLKGNGTHSPNPNGTANGTKNATVSVKVNYR